MGFMAGFGKAFSEGMEANRDRKFKEEQYALEDKRARDRTQLEYSLRESFELKKLKAEEEAAQAKLVRANVGHARMWGIPEKFAIEAAGDGVDFSKLGDKERADLLSYDYVADDGTVPAPPTPAVTQTTAALGQEGPSVTATPTAPSTTEGTVPSRTAYGFKMTRKPGQAEVPKGTTELAGLLAQARLTGDEAAVKLYEDQINIQAAMDRNANQAERGFSTHLVRDPETGQVAAKSLKPQTNVATGQTTYIEWDGNTYSEGQARGLSEQEMKLEADILTQADSQEVKDIKGKVADTAVVASLFAQADKIVQDSGGAVLAQKVVSLSQIADSTVKEVVTGLGLFGDQEMVTGMTDEELKAKEEQVTQKLGAVTDQAQRGALFKAKMALAVYRSGRAEAQSGRDFTTMDVQKINEIINVSTDPESFRRNFASYLQTLVDDVDSRGQMLNDYNAKIDMLKRSTKGYSPVEKFAPSVGEYVTNGTSGDAKVGYELMEQTNANPMLAREEQPQTQQEQSQMSVDPAAIELLMSDPSPEAQAEFDEIFGAGSSARYMKR